MDAKELIDLIWPNHVRTTCSDDNVTNGFGTMGRTAKGVLTADGRCLRCMLLELIQGHTDDGEPIPPDGPAHLREDW